MNIVNERPGEAVQELMIEIERNDYLEKVESALKKHRQRASIPGFRPGNAPMGMIRKMYYKNFLADTVNELIGKSLYNYFEENKLNVIFEPLPIEEKSSADFDNSENFTFAFEFAIKPEFEIDYANLPAVKSYKVTASESEIAEYIENLQKRFGNYTNPEVVDGEDDFVTVMYEDGKSGFVHYGDLNEKGKKLFHGKKVEDEFEIPVKKIFDDLSLVARFLKVKEDELQEDNDYTVTGKIENIGRMEPAELNEDFFAKAFADGSVKDEKQMRAKAVDAIEDHWKNETDRYFINNAIKVLLDHVAVAIPDDFVKRYLLQTQENITQEIIDNEYESYANTFKWQLIENKIAGENEIKVDNDEIKSYVRDFFYANYFAQFSMADVAERLDSLVDDALKNKEDVKKIYDTLFDKKMEDVLRGKMNLDEQSGDFKEFVTFVTGEKPEEEVAKAPKKKAAKPKAQKEEVENEGKEEAAKSEKVKKTKKEENADTAKEENSEPVVKKKTTKKTTKKEE